MLWIHHIHLLAPHPTPTPTPTTTLQRWEKGSSLIEVLISILIVSLGLLGVAGMTASSIGANKMSQYRLTASNLAHLYADSARMNVYGFDDGLYDITLSDTQSPGTLTTFTLTTVDAQDSKTSATNIANYDRSFFVQEAQNRLRNGALVHVKTTRSATERSMDIWILWKSANNAYSDTLLSAGNGQCPKETNFSADDMKKYYCAYFKVGI